MSLPPFARLRRLRSSETLRSMVRETTLSVTNLIMPFFAVEGKKRAEPIGSMPGISRLSVDLLAKRCAETHALGVPAVLLFGVPPESEKSADARLAHDDKGLVQRAIRAIKTAAPDLFVITDVCLCAYTDTGHCGVVGDDARGPNTRRVKSISNDPTIEILARVAKSYADAGADMVAPSDMMDGRIATIRMLLDGTGYADLPIMSYAAKYASAYYGPFREAAHSAPKFGDRRTHQMDPANLREAMREIEEDIAEGADVVMVKPGLPYLDVLREARLRFDVPLAVYNVSGEYAMVKFAAQAGAIDERNVVMETMTAFRRAGADLIITYFANDVAKHLGGAR